jgi:riboflavin biosynthesis pyrimidine reductase
MSQVIRQIKVPVKVRLWRSRKNYIAVVTDEAAKKVLEQYLDKKVEVEIAGVTIEARLVKVWQRSTWHVGVFLPRRLTPTWEKLRQRAEDHDAVIVITEGGERL